MEIICLTELWKIVDTLHNIALDGFDLTDCYSRDITFKGGMEEYELIKP